ncbi:hypothetical protein [Georgenia sp. H159]|uniref:hypothetical protein n=1 Tax=Georgenia sp. H159 TaxID=3076115 RepID=UPI002D778A74|nr:hypothetical protein [Georgenia sp. H159]
MSDNIIGYAVSQGVDVTDPAALDAFMTFYNNLPHDVRVEISDGEWRDDLDDEEWADEDWIDDDELEGAFPAFLGTPADDDALEAHLATVDEHAYFVDATLMQRADRVLRHIGEAHPFTEDEGLGGEATVSLMEQFGHATDDIATTWDAMPVSVLVAGLAGGGYLEVSGGEIRPAAMVAPWAWPDAPPEERTSAGRVLHATTLGAFLEETDEGSTALAPPFTAIALMTVCGPGGLHLPETVAEPDEFEPLRQNVRADLLVLEDVGIVERDGDVFTASPVLLTVLPAVLESVSGALPG